jgi:hypothetical protein
MVIDDTFGDLSAPKLRAVADSSAPAASIKRVKILPLQSEYFTEKEEAQKVCNLYSSAVDNPQSPLHYLAIRNDFANTFANQSLEGLSWYYSVVPEGIGFAVLVLFGNTQHMVAAGYIEESVPMEASD